jgi:hypothetical protein
VAEKLEFPDESLRFSACKASVESDVVVSASVIAAGLRNIPITAQFSKARILTSIATYNKHISISI